jgi:hypothetical protein
MMRGAILPFLIVAFSLATAAAVADDAQKSKGPIVRVKVTRSGSIQLDGRRVSLEDLDQPFAKAAAAHGTVYYYREDPSGEAPPIASQVLKKIIDHKLPVRLCADFQDQDCKQGIP